MIIFNKYFGSYAQRQLIADHINYSQNVYIDSIEGDFSNYVEKKTRKNWEWGGKVELFALSKNYRCLNWASVWCQRFLNKAFTNSIVNWEENKCSLP